MFRREWFYVDELQREKGICDAIAPLRTFRLQRFCRLSLTATTVIPFHHHLRRYEAQLLMLNSSQFQSLHTCCGLQYGNAPTLDLIMDLPSHVIKRDISRVYNLRQLTAHPWIYMFSSHQVRSPTAQERRQQHPQGYSLGSIEFGSTIRYTTTVQYPAPLAVRPPISLIRFAHKLRTTSLERPHTVESKAFLWRCGKH